MAHVPLAGSLCPPQNTASIAPALPLSIPPLQASLFAPPPAPHPQPSHLLPVAPPLVETQPVQQNTLIQQQEQQHSTAVPLPTPTPQPQSQPTAQHDLGTGAACPDLVVLTTGHTDLSTAQHTHPTPIAEPVTQHTDALTVHTLNTAVEHTPSNAVEHTHPTVDQTDTNTAEHTDPTNTAEHTDHLPAAAIRKQRKARTPRVTVPTLPPSTPPAGLHTTSSPFALNNPHVLPPATHAVHAAQPHAVPHSMPQHQPNAYTQLLLHGLGPAQPQAQAQNTQGQTQGSSFQDLLQGYTSVTAAPNPQTITSAASLPTSNPFAPFFYDNNNTNTHTTTNTNTNSNNAHYWAAAAAAATATNASNNPTYSTHPFSNAPTSLPHTQPTPSHLVTQALPLHTTSWNSLLSDLQHAASNQGGMHTSSAQLLAPAPALRTEPSDALALLSGDLKPSSYHASWPYHTEQHGSRQPTPGIRSGAAGRRQGRGTGICLEDGEAGTLTYPLLRMLDSYKSVSFVRTQELKQLFGPDAKKCLPVVKDVMVELDGQMLPEVHNNVVFKETGASNSVSMKGFPCAQALQKLHAGFRMEEEAIVLLLLTPPEGHPLAVAAAEAEAAAKPKPPRRRTLGSRSGRRSNNRRRGEGGRSSARTRPASGSKRPRRPSNGASSRAVPRSTIKRARTNGGRMARLEKQEDAEEESWEDDADGNEDTDYMPGESGRAGSFNQDDSETPEVSFSDEDRGAGDGGGTDDAVDREEGENGDEEDGRSADAGGAQPAHKKVKREERDGDRVNEQQVPPPGSCDASDHHQPRLQLDRSASKGELTRSNSRQARRGQRRKQVGSGLATAAGVGSEKQDGAAVDAAGSGGKEAADNEGGDALNQQQSLHALADLALLEQGGEDGGAEEGKGIGQKRGRSVASTAAKGGGQSSVVSPTKRVETPPPHVSEAEHTRHAGGQAPHGKDLLRASSGVGHQQSGAVGREAGGREDGVRIQGQPLECMLQALRSLGAQPESLSAAQQGLQGRGADELLAMKEAALRATWQALGLRKELDRCKEGSAPC